MSGSGTRVSRTNSGARNASTDTRAAEVNDTPCSPHLCDGRWGGSGAEVGRVAFVPVPAGDVAVEVARQFESDVGGRLCWGGAVPVPAAGWAADHVAGPDHVYTVLVPDDADAVDEDEVLAAVVHVRDGSCAGSEMHGH